MSDSSSEQESESSSDESESDEESESSEASSASSENSESSESEEESSDSDDNEPLRPQSRTNIRGKNSKMALQIPLNLQILARQNVCIPLTVMALGLTQGLLLPIMNDYPQDLGASSAQLASIETGFYLPVYFKIFLAFLSDARPIQGYRRKSYIFIGWLICIGSILGLASLADTSYKSGTVPPANSPSMMFLSIVVFFYGFGSAIVSVCIDGMIVEKYIRESDKRKGYFFVACLAFKYSGFVISLPTASLLYDNVGNVPILVLLGVIPCLTFPFLWLVVEDTKIENTQKVLPSPKALVRNIWDVLKSRSAYQTMGALFLYLVLQVRNTALNEMLEHDGISMYDINVATTMGVFSIFLGVLVYGKFWMKKSWKKMLAVTTGVNAMLTLLQLFLVKGFGGLAFAIAERMMTGFVDAHQLLPVLLMLAGLSAVNLSEATLFAMFATITNFAIATSESISVALQTAFNVSSETLDTLTPRKLTSYIVVLTFLPLFSLLGIMYVPVHNRKFASWSTTKKVCRGLLLIGAMTMSAVYAMVVILMNCIAYQVAVS